MTAVAQKTVLTGCLAPIDRGGLEQLIVNGKANPNVIKTLKCKTVAEGKFRHANYIRNLAPYIVDEPPGLLGDDTAPNPSEASLAALGRALRSAFTPMRCIAAGSSTSSSSSSRAISTSPRFGARATSARSRSVSPTSGSRSTWNARAFRRARSMRWSSTSRNGRRSPTPSRGRSIRGQRLIVQCPR